MRRSWSRVNPLGTGVPVEGARSGSRTSMSKERWMGVLGPM